MNEQLDAIIATAIMGWKVHPRNTAHWMRANDDSIDYRPVAFTCGSDRFAPSSNIKDAWKVVEKMADIKDDARWWNMTAGAFICIDLDDGHPKSLARIMFDCPQMMPLAICLAALEASGLSAPVRPNPKDHRDGEAVSGAFSLLGGPNRSEDLSENTWISVSQEHPPIGLDVLVSDGDEVKIDHESLYYELNGRGLLPSDPRRATTEPIRIFSKYSNVTHWMRLPCPPNPQDQRAGHPAPMNPVVGPLSDTEQ